MRKTACAFTGHRPERFGFGNDENSERCLEIKALLEEWITALVESGVNTFYTGMARGVDQWAASAVLDIKKESPCVRLIAVVPCEEQANNWPEDQRERYFNTLAECNDVITLQTKYTPSCMHERNRYLVNHADYLLAVYDGSGKGGTASTVKYGRSKEREIIIINPETLETVSPASMDALKRRGQMRIAVI